MKHYFDPNDLSYGSVPDDLDIPEGCIEVDAQPLEDFTRHDETGAVIKDAAARADFEAGQDHIARAHAVKEIEARLIVAGVALDGLLKAESDALGIDLEELAALVLERAEAFKQKEVNRRVMKSERINDA